MNDKTIVKAAKNVVENGEGVARNIWLAGLGLYSRTLEEAQQVNEKTTTVFDELVERGKEVETQTKERIAKKAEQVTDEAEAGKNDLLYRLSGIDREKLDHMDNKIDRLTQAVEKLAEIK
ncbi:phasin family protein [Photobacterium sp.]|uniref:phasin family protein n=1 Tax=Photobacterium sp. TaxID=660 RepID=UPI00299CDD25|nr:phasin family protein [Photobacterium sp.]MDX1303616.1 phasin family protein [Photobacterium sp.]